MALKNADILLYSKESTIEYLLRRWYDKDEVLTQAFEYLKNSDEELRKKIAVSIIEFLQNL